MIDIPRLPNGELPNDFRADRAQAALDAYIDYTGDAPDESAFRDLLCDLRHLAARDGAGHGYLLGRAAPMTFDEANDFAARSFAEEVALEEDEDKDAQVRARGAAGESRWHHGLLKARKRA